MHHPRKPVCVHQIVERIEPSYVIRKYLDAQRIKNLTDFLEKLHEVIDSQNQTIMGQDAGRLTPFSIPAALGSQTAP